MSFTAGRIIVRGKPHTRGKQKRVDYILYYTPNLPIAVIEANFHRQYLDDPDRCEYFVPIQWLQTVPLSQAIQELGMFGNQNSVCKPTTPKWRTTVERLKTRFPSFEGQ